MRHGAHRALDEATADHRHALRSACALAALVLAPVAGPWRDGEVLARHPVAGDADPGEVWSSLLSGRPLPSSAGG